MAYVYKHLKMDTNDIFYIGIGTDKNRIFSKKSRNRYWHNIVNKYGIKYEIIEKDLTWDEACKREKYWISFYSRENLCNMTDGGEGSYGRKVSEYTRKRISESNKGKKQSKEARQKISEGNKGKSKPKPKGFGEKISKIVSGTKRSEESKIKQSISTKKTLLKIKEKIASEV